MCSDLRVPHVRRACRQGKNVHPSPRSGSKVLSGFVRVRWVLAFALVATTLIVPAATFIVPAAPARAAGPTAVTLEFDNGAISQYALGYLQALKPHGTPATFFVNSGTIGSSPNFMTWNQLTSLAAGENDIGGKSVNASNLTTDPNPTAQVCNDRKAILQHGLTPVGFAYPGGTNNATVQAIVKNCQYGNARTAGGVSPGGAVETRPPANWYATKAYAPSTVTLANMQSVVNGADSRGGGWAQIVIGRVCSQSLDPNNYAACSAASGHVELADLNAFLDWMANAGQAGGAPAGATAQRARRRDRLGGHQRADDDDRMQRRTLRQHTVRRRGERDAGGDRHRSGVASTHYTIDGTAPTLVQPDVHGCVQRQQLEQLDDCEVPVVGLRGQRGGRPDPGGRGTDGRDGADYDHRLQRLDVRDVRTSRP